MAISTAEEHLSRQVCFSFSAISFAEKLERFENLSFDWESFLWLIKFVLFCFFKERKKERNVLIYSKKIIYGKNPNCLSF